MKLIHTNTLPTYLPRWLTKKQLGEFLQAVGDIYPRDLPKTFPFALVESMTCPRFLFAVAYADLIDVNANWDFYKGHAIGNAKTLEMTEEQCKHLTCLISFF